MAVDETRFRVMASDAHAIVVDGPPEAGTVAERALEQLESTWSRFIDSSDICRLNDDAGRPVLVDPTTITLIETMLKAWEMTDGRYDPTILPALLSAGYVNSIDDVRGHTTLPTPGHHPFRASSVAPLPFDRVHVGPDGHVTLPTSLAIDAGGIGKGLAADMVVAELLMRGARGALISIGGDLAAAGDAPEGSGWRIDIEDSFDPSDAAAQMMVSGGGVATSSTQTRRWTIDETEGHHTIDPATGEPSQTDLASVTVVAACGWQAEVHATALLLGGSSRFHTYASSKQIEAVATTAWGATLATATFERIQTKKGGRP